MTEAAYDQDFYAWTQDQARRLREAATARTNLPLDFENLAEEIESMGNRDWKTAQSCLMRIIEHLLKLEHSPAKYPRKSWKKSVIEHRIRLLRDLEQSGSLRAKLHIDAAFADAERLAAIGLTKDRLSIQVQLPEVCPYTVEQLLDHDWWPSNRHGIED